MIDNISSTNLINIDTNLPMEGLVRIRVPGDGSCLFHSILRAFNQKYITSTPEQRSNFVRLVRDKLADALEEIDQKTNKKYYYTIANGNLASLGENLPDYSLPSIQALLRSTNSVGAEIISSLSYFFDIEVLIYNMLTNDINMYNLDAINGKKRIIILAYTEFRDINDGHYDLIGIKYKGNIYTLFDSGCFLIQSILNRRKPS